MWYIQADPEKMAATIRAMWQGVFGDRVEICGEIHNREDDMAGTAENPCYVTNIIYTLADGSEHSDVKVKI